MNNTRMSTQKHTHEQAHTYIHPDTIKTRYLQTAWLVSLRELPERRNFRWGFAQQHTRGGVLRTRGRHTCPGLGIGSL